MSIFTLFSASYYPFAVYHYIIAHYLSINGKISLYLYHFIDNNAYLANIKPHLLIIYTKRYNNLFEWNISEKRNRNQGRRTDRSPHSRSIVPGTWMGEENECLEPPHCGYRRPEVASTSCVTLTNAGARRDQDKTTAKESQGATTKG